jgi:hypothetical protein
MPCEIVTKKSKNKSEEKSEEKSIEKKEETTKKTEESTKKPSLKTKSSRRRRSARNSSLGNKRCIGDLFGGLRRDIILGASNPQAADCDRYESENEVASSNVQSKTVENDNKAYETILQAIPSKQQFFGGKLLGDKPKTLNLFKKISSSKTENLIHGNLPKSIESNEVEKKVPETAEEDSSQVESSNAQTVEPFVPPQYSKYDPPSYEPNDYLPSFEYFPKNKPTFQPIPQQSYPQNQHSTVVIGPSSFKSSPIYEHHGQQHDISVPSYFPHQPQLPQNALPTHDKPFVVGPSSFKSSPLYDHLGSQQEIAHTTKRYTDKPDSSGCRCDPEHFDDFLHHMQSSYSQFHNGMIQLFDTFKSQTNCGSKTPQISDSSSSHSHPNFDYNVHCHDKNVVNSDPELSILCQKAFVDSGVDPSGGYYNPPGAAEVKTGGFKNQFLSYQDYIKMMQNVNYNSGTVLSSSHDIDDDVVAASHKSLPDDDSHEKTVNQLRQHISQYESEIVAAAPEPQPEPIAEEPQLAATPETPVDEPEPVKNPLQFQIKSFLPEWKPLIKI